MIRPFLVFIGCIGLFFSGGALAYAQAQYSPYLGGYHPTAAEYDASYNTYVFKQDQNLYWDPVSYLVKAGVKLFDPSNRVAYSIQSNNLAALGAVRRKVFTNYGPNVVVITSGFRAYSQSNLNHPYGAMDFRNKHLSMFERLLEGALVSKTLSSQTGRDRRVLVEGPIKGNAILITQFIDGNLVSSEWHRKGKNQSECIHIDTLKNISFAEENIIPPSQWRLNALSAQQIRSIITQMERRTLLPEGTNVSDSSAQELSWGIQNSINNWEHTNSAITGTPYYQAPVPYAGTFVSEALSAQSGLVSSSTVFGLKDPAPQGAGASSAGGGANGQSSESRASDRDSAREVGEYRDSQNDGPREVRGDVSLGPTEVNR